MLEILGLLILFIGLSLIAIALCACYKLPDVITKVHAASIIDSLALPLSLFGVIMLQDNIQSIMKLVFIIVLIYLVAPVSAHAIGQIYLHNKDEGRDAT